MGNVISPIQGGCLQKKISKLDTLREEMVDAAREEFARFFGVAPPMRPHS